MRRIALVLGCLALVSSSTVLAQRRPEGRGGRGRAQAPAAAAPSNEEAPAEEEEPTEEAPPEQLRAPTFEQPRIEAPPPVEEEPSAPEIEAEPAPAPRTEEPPAAETEPSDAETVLSADDATEQAGSGISTSDPTAPSQWTSPQSVLTLHGYFRTRLEFQDRFSLGRVYQDGADAPFDAFHPADSRPGTEVEGGCGASAGTGPCDSSSFLFASMRLRLAPQLNLGDDVRVKFLFDVFDNMVLGSTGDSALLVPGGSTVMTSPYAQLQPFVTSALPPTYARNSLTDSIVARRAWAEIRNRTLGELRFGRMGFHWGLGMVANSGDNLDGDYSTEVDRIMAITKLWGFYLMAAYDFSFAGLANSISGGTSTDSAMTYDVAQNDNVHQFFFAVARRSTPEEQEASLARGDAVLNAGAFFTYRSQLLSSVYRTTDPLAEPTTTFVRRNAELFTPDVWLQFLWGKLRLEAEAALSVGSIENIAANSYSPQNLAIRQFGLAFEGEYRLFDDKLGLYFNAGYGSGDSDAEGLGAFADTLSRQGGRTGAISTFRFHPNYRVDLILWRQILRQVTGAYYFRPGVSYDFMRSPLGRQLGGRFDLIYSRASDPVQTWGNDPNLGVELNATLYFRSEDGPEVFDGFHAMVQYGVLFPMQGLGYLSNAGVDQIAGGNPSLKTAQTLRVILGVVF